MDIRRVQIGNSEYLSSLSTLGEESPQTLYLFGYQDILQNHKISLFCSKKCPGNLIVATYDLACSLRDKGVTVISGFHTPMEKEALKYLLKGKQPIIICPARSIEGMRMPSAWKRPLDEGRLLILSPFEKEHKRITAELADTRNRIVAAIADEVLIVYAHPGGKTEAFAKEVVGWKKPVFTLRDEKNQNLIKFGVVVKAIGP